MRWTTTDEAFEALLRYMRDSRGFDFTGYKRNSLIRRVRHRMTQAGSDTFEEYLDVLQASSDRTFLDSLLNSVHLGLVVVDREMKVVVWNRGCEDLDIQG